MLCLLSVVPCECPDFSDSALHAHVMNEYRMPLSVGEGKYAQDIRARGATCDLCALWSHSSLCHVSLLSVSHNVTSDTMFSQNNAHTVIFILPDRKKLTSSMRIADEPVLCLALLRSCAVSPGPCPPPVCVC